MPKTIYPSDLKNPIEVVRSIWHADNAPPDDYIWLLFRQDSTGKVRSVCLRPDDPRIPQLVESAQRDKVSVWFSVNGFVRPPDEELNRGKGRTLERVRYLHALHVDFDFPDAVKKYLQDVEAKEGRPLTWPELVPLLLNPPEGIPVMGQDYPTPGQFLASIVEKGFPLPTYLWFTGGGYDATWILKQPISLKQRKKKGIAMIVERLLVERLEGDLNAADLARVIRWPGSINFKYCKGVGIKGTVLGGSKQLVDWKAFAPLIDEAEQELQKQEEAAKRIKNLRKELVAGEDLESIAQRVIQLYFSLFRPGKRNETLKGVTAFLALAGYDDYQAIVELVAPTLREADPEEFEHHLLPELKVLAKRAVERRAKGEPLKLFPEGCTEEFKREVLRLLDLARGRRKGERIKASGENQFPWLLIGTKMKDDGTMSVSVKVDYPSLAEEVVKESHAHIGTKNGDIAVAYVWDEERKIYRDDVGLLRSRIYQKLRTAELWLRDSGVTDNIVLSTTHHVAETMNYIAARFGRPVEEVLAEFNDYSRYLPVKNGLLDMETGELLERTPEHLFSFVLPVEWDPTADTHAVEDYLRGLVHPDDLTNLRRFLGYLLVPHQPLKAYAILVGPPDSGKTTLLFDLLRDHVLGRDQVSTVSMTTLTTKRFAPIKLVGKLANFASESPDLQGGVDSELLKSITGGDAIFVEEKHRPAFSATIGAKLCFAVNSIPSLPDDPALWARTIIIRFPHRFQRSEEAKKRIISLAPAMLKAMVQWRREVLEQGFEVNIDEVRAKALEYSDPLKAFFLQSFEESPMDSVELVDAYVAFCEWAQAHGLKPGALGRLVMSPDLVRRYLSESGPESIKYKLRSFAQRLKKVLEEEGYFDALYKDPERHRVVLLGFRLRRSGESSGTQQFQLNEAFQRIKNAADRYRQAIEIAKALSAEMDAWAVDDFIEMARSVGFSEEDAHNLWNALATSGEVQEVRRGIYRLVVREGVRA